MYLDPGFGGMLVQIVVALVALGGALLFTMRKKIKALFTQEPKIDGSANSMSNINVDSEEDVIDTLTDETDTQE